MKKITISLFILLFIFILGACGNDESEQEQTSEQRAGEVVVDILEDEQVDAEDVVAKVNGQEIQGDIYNFIYAQIKVSLHQLGYESDNIEEMKDLALSILINQTLLKQDAENRDIIVSESEVDEEFELYKANVDGLFSMLATQPQLSEAVYKDQLHFELIHEKYIESELNDVEVTEAEIEEAYEGLKEQLEEVPALEEIKVQLESELLIQKEQDLLQTKVEELEKQADIETMI